MKLFNSIAPEIIIVPIALMVGAAIAIVLFDRTMSQSTNSMLAAELEQANVRETLVTIETSAERARGEATQYLALVGSGLEDAKLDEIKARADKELAEAVAQVTGLSNDAARVEWMAAANQGPAVLGLIKAYHDALEDLNQMASLDRLIGVSMVGNVEDKFNQLHKGLLAWRATVKDAGDRHRERINSDAARARLTILASAAAGMALLLGVCLVLVQRLVRSITVMSNRMSALSQGDTDSAIPGAGRKDEIGTMAEAVVIFRDNAREVQALQAERVRAEQAAAQERRQMFHGLSADFKSKVSGSLSALERAIDTLRRHSEDMLSRAEDSSVRAQTIHHTANSASVDAQSVAAAIEELSVSISEIAAHALRSTEAVSRSVATAADAESKVGELDLAVHSVAEIVGLINDIAGQTNLLALNAMIEAARAGEAGKGFAVVAGEVKSLATQTAKATEEISRVVQKINDTKNLTSQAIESMVQAMMAIRDGFSQISGAVTQQKAATQEISAKIASVAAGLDGMVAEVDYVAQSAEQTSGKAREVIGSARTLSETSSHLADASHSFVESLRA